MADDGDSGVRGAASPTLCALPHSVLQAIAARLGVDDCLLLSSACPALRGALADPALWRDVSLAEEEEEEEEEQGAPCGAVGDGCGGAGSSVSLCAVPPPPPPKPSRPVSDALLLAACARARGGLRSLDVRGRLGGDPPAPGLSLAALLAACRASAPTLASLNARCPAALFWRCLPHAWAAALLGAAPNLARLDIDVFCSSAAQASALLRHPAARVRRLLVIGPFVGGVGDGNGGGGGGSGGGGGGAVAAAGAAAAATALAALLRDLAAHPWLDQVALRNAPLAAPAAVDALVDVALRRRLAGLRVRGCRLGPGAVAPLARLLLLGAPAAGGRLAALKVHNDNHGPPLAPSPGFCAALRCATRLERFKYSSVRLWEGGLCAGLALLAAAEGHPTLRHVDLHGNAVAAAPRGDRAAVGAAVGRLVSAAGGALTSLDISFCGLSDAGLAPLADALPGCTRLRSLECCGSGLSPPFAAVLLAAVRVNASLRRLVADDLPPVPGLAEAEALVAARA